MKCLLPLLLLSATAACAGTMAPPDLPLPVASFGAASLPAGDIFIYGGHSGVRHRYNRDEVNGTLHRWRMGAETWERLTDDEPAQGASLVTTDKGVVRIGGMAARNEKGKKQDLWSSETASIYDVDMNAWRPLPNLPERRSSHDSAIIGHTLYVIGGWALSGGSDPKWHNNYLTLDLADPMAAWQTHPQPFERRALAALAVGTRLYAIGGMDSGDKPTSAVSVLDTTTGLWSEGPPLPQDKLGGFGFAAVAQEGRVFASGAPGVLLELRGGAWVGITRLKHPRFFHRLVPGGAGHLIALGGESRDGKKALPESIALPKADSAPLAEADALPASAVGANLPPHGSPRS